MTDQITGIDYLTGERGIPLSELRVLTEEKTDSGTFPETPDGYPTFAAKFCRKYGVAGRGQAPIVLTETSDRVIRSFWEGTDGSIHRVDPRKARKSW